MLQIYQKQDLKNYTNLKYDADLKERMLLILNVVYDKQIPTQVARNLHRSKTWASDWLKRYREEGIEGLKNRTKSGRPPDIPKETVYKIKSQLASSKQGWTTKQVNDIIIRESGGKISLYSYLQINSQVGIQTEGTKKSTCKHSIKRRERRF